MGNNCFMIVGGFVGLVDGGGGIDMIVILGGSEVVLIVFGVVLNIENFVMFGGFVMVLGMVVFGNVDLIGG